MLRAAPTLHLSFFVFNVAAWNACSLCKCEQQDTVLWRTFIATRTTMSMYSHHRSINVALRVGGGIPGILPERRSKSRSSE